ncbi:MAG: formylmethanofuran dehydrogenase subunit A [Candidatus Altiarchaeales archaeon HGW-Altiarchaeales-1]|nr:MAG: formylmethanofuran dehydrogenase subunit A [Candidatus Altiarchaeales archaeon HGW-Altiarchaeales-1]
MMIIKNGKVYDPANRIDGEIIDIYVKGGKIVEEPVNERNNNDDIIIDAKGLLVMPGGVDIHSHIAGPKVTKARVMCPDDHRKDSVRKTKITRSGTGYTVPTTFVTGYRYAKLGYTFVAEAASPPIATRHTHEEFNDIPIIDKTAYILMGSNHFVLDNIAKGNFDGLKNYVGFLLNATKGYAIKIVNPGGVENWKWGKNVNGLDDIVINYGVTPREILQNLAKVRRELNLSHAIHVHCNNLGSPGNFKTTLETIDALKGEPIHITHIQFNSYAGDGWANFASAANEISDKINSGNNATVDVGQVIFGNATTMTADGPWQHTVYKLSHQNKWANVDAEMETGAGIVPYIFKENNAVNAIQWAIGLEIFLLIKDPFKVCLTTDHPNAGPFYYYPNVVEYLMSKKKRDEMLNRINQKAKERTTLANIDREYTLQEIATITRAATAKIMGLKNKGHLGAGADADIAVYKFDENNIANSFSSAKYVIKDGKVVVKDGEIVENHLGRTYYVKAKGEANDEIKETFEKFYSVSFENYAVEDVYVPKREIVECYKE